MIIIKCSKCNNVWEYKPRKERRYCSCPKCMSCLSIKKNRIDFSNGESNDKK
jgi:hypothetical protein